VFGELLLVLITLCM